MVLDFLSSLQCVLQDEETDYQAILRSWREKDIHMAFMPAIGWFPGTFNLFDRKAGEVGENMIWLIPAGQADYFWLPTLKKEIEDFYKKDEFEIGNHSHFPSIERETFEECILLHSKDLQDAPEHVINGANVILVRLLLSSGRDTLLFILLDHQDHCWKNINERYHVPLTWFVDSGRGMGDYYTYTNLYQLMKNTSYTDILPALYFKGLYNKGILPEGFRFLYAMLSQPDADGSDKWHTFSAVYDTGWKK